MRVKIKTWKELEQEFGLDDSGNINSFFRFTTEMENLLPKDRVIDIIETKLLPKRDDIYYLYKYAWFPDGDTLNGWSYAICEDELYGT